MAQAPPFLGTGWSFPPAFGANGREVAMVSGVDDVHQSLQILLSTRLGERVMQDGFGCDLSDYLFEEIDQSLISGLSSLISRAIVQHETRIRLERVSIDRSNDNVGLLLIHIDYIIKTTNSRFNMVYPFYINEATMPASGI